MTILMSAFALGGLGLLFGFGLAIASRLLAVKEDDRLQLVREALPGANCGACGFTGCDAFAKALILGEAKVNGCPVGRQELADRLAELLGQPKAVVEAQVAVVRCQGSNDHCHNKFKYLGVEDCLAATQVSGGPKSCEHSCLGMGSCRMVCQFDAIHIENGLATIDPEKCTACRCCVSACPKHLIQMLPQVDRDVMVLCCNPLRGKAVSSECSVGCIGCGKCARICPEGAIVMEQNLPNIDYAKCSGCMACAEGCPTGAIRKTLVKKD